MLRVLTCCIAIFENYIVMYLQSLNDVRVIPSMPKINFPNVRLRNQFLARIKGSLDLELPFGLDIPSWGLILC